MGAAASALAAQPSLSLRVVAPSAQSCRPGNPPGSRAWGRRPGSSASPQKLGGWLRPGSLRHKAELGLAGTPVCVRVEQAVDRLEPGETGKGEARGEAGWGPPSAHSPRGVLLQAEAPSHVHHVVGVLGAPVAQGDLGTQALLPLHVPQEPPPSATPTFWAHSGTQEAWEGQGRREGPGTFCPAGRHLIASPTTPHCRLRVHLPAEAEPRGAASTGSPGGSGRGGCE